MNIRYVKRAIPEGLGSQIKTLAVLIPFAEKFDLKVISDARTFPYFRNRGASFLSDDKLAQLLEFHPRIIYNSKQIDSVDKSEVFDLYHWETHHQILDWLICESEARGTWNEIVNNPNRSDEPRSCPTQLPIRIKDRELIKKYESRIRNSIAVHARLGNGETNKKGEKIGRMAVKDDKFIEEMKKYDEDFFVCSDTFEFIEKCERIFGDRVFYMDRNRTPEGLGAGYMPNEEHFKNGQVSKEIPGYVSNQWDNFYEALAEMELLSKGKHLIHNSSGFISFALKNCPHTDLWKRRANRKL
tara:strand:- start:215 stop:1111 length:897 start_codon:yes stop_codon:yes gene_type:complete